MLIVFGFRAWHLPGGELWELWPQHSLSPQHDGVPYRHPDKGEENCGHRKRKTLYSHLMFYQVFPLLCCGHSGAPL